MAATSNAGTMKKYEKFRKKGSNILNDVKIETDEKSCSAKGAVYAQPRTGNEGKDDEQIHGASLKRNIKS